MADKSMSRVLKGVDEVAKTIKGRNKDQDAIKDYTGHRLSHVVKEKIDGKMEDIHISHPDTHGILEDVRKTPLNPKEHPRKKK